MPSAAVAHTQQLSVVASLQNLVGLIPLALLLGEVTEDLAIRLGETIGGLLNATFGKSPCCLSVTHEPCWLQAIHRQGSLVVLKPCKQVTDFMLNTSTYPALCYPGSARAVAGWYLRAGSGYRIRLQGSCSRQTVHAPHVLLLMWCVSCLSFCLACTAGNVVELILSIAALQAGLYDVVATSLLGSILSNLLLVLGMSFFVGGLK